MEFTKGALELWKIMAINKFVIKWRKTSNFNIWPKFLPLKSKYPKVLFQVTDPPLILSYCFAWFLNDFFQKSKFVGIFFPVKIKVDKIANCWKMCKKNMNIFLRIIRKCNFWEEMQQEFAIWQFIILVSKCLPL